MPHVAVQTRIHAPPNVVFSAITDFANAPRRITGIEAVQMLTDGPVGKGTRFRETRIVFGKQASETMTVTAWDPPRSYTLGCQSCGCEYSFTLACQGDARDAGATIVDATIDARPMTFLARLFSPLSRLMMGSCRKAFEKDLDDLRRSIESGPASAGAAQPA
jgi:carbon monoxide dehydrogenase subunit G